MTTTNTSAHAALRSAILATVPRRRIPMRLALGGVEHDVELRMLTLAERDECVARANAYAAAKKRDPSPSEMAAHFVIAALVVPGTDEKLLTQHDVEAVLEMPMDSGIGALFNGVGRMMEEAAQVGKGSAPSRND